MVECALRHSHNHHDEESVVVVEAESTLYWEEIFQFLFCIRCSVDYFIV